MRPDSCAPRRQDAQDAPEESYARCTPGRPEGAVANPWANTHSARHLEDTLASQRLRQIVNISCGHAFHIRLLHHCDAETPADWEVAAFPMRGKPGADIGRDTSLAVRFIGPPHSCRRITALLRHRGGMWIQLPTLKGVWLSYSLNRTEFER